MKRIQATPKQMCFEHLKTMENFSVKSEEEQKDFLDRFWEAADTEAKEYFEFMASMFFCDSEDEDDVNDM